MCAHQVEITVNLVKKLISDQFPKFAHLQIESVKVQGHDNRTFRLGNEMLVRMPVSDVYALKVPKEQALLPRLSRYLPFFIPVPIAMGMPSNDYPFNFSIYQWLDGESINNVIISDYNLENIACDLVLFLQNGTVAG